MQARGTLRNACQKSEKWEVLNVHGDEQLYHNAIPYGLPRERNPAKCVPE